MFYSGELQRLEWEQAKDQCEVCGGKLVEPMSQANNDAISTFVQDKTTRVPGPLPNAVWIGVQTIGGAG